MAIFSQAVKKVSFRGKEPVICPICKAEHHKEELMSGGGRLIAGKLTQELRRLYEESKKYGKIHPLAYVIQTCPKCLYSSFPKDFSLLKEENIKAIRDTTTHRQKLTQVLFNNIDFNNDRDLVLGTASYILAIDCYHLRSHDTAPTPKKAVCSMRAAWMLDDLYSEASYRPYDKARDFYYMEAVKNYAKCLEIMERGGEPIESAGYILGPDQDHNWGFDGIIYLNAFLTKKFSNQLSESVEEEYKMLEKAKRYLSKLYGTGKSSKSKPTVIVDMSKDLYDEIGKVLDTLKSKSVSAS
ncbi:MAG: DUF2225 domain-containing protein [Spirochaetia bacterium]|nr:DUF2225 domain-containing protein [Spirochaetia bacterium]